MKRLIKKNKDPIDTITVADCTIHHFYYVNPNSEDTTGGILIYDRNTKRYTIRAITNLTSGDYFLLGNLITKGSDLGDVLNFLIDEGCYINVFAYRSDFFQFLADLD